MPKSKGCGCGTFVLAAFALMGGIEASISYTAPDPKQAAGAARSNDLSPASDISTYFIDSKVRLHHPFYGCPAQESLDKVRDMGRAHDLPAIEAAAARGNCLWLYPGDYGTVVDHSVWHDATCMRRAGEPDCLWVPDDVLEKDVPKPPTTPVAAGPRAADSPRCKAAIVQIAETTQATVSGYSPSGDNAFLRHPAAADVMLSCASAMRMSVSASWSGGRPPASYFALIAAVGAAVTHEKAERLLPLIKRCQAKAHRSHDESDEENLPHAEIDCTSFDRDGGDTLINVAQGKDDPVP